ncbi:hypothetical protein D1BOALGB6SA_1482 [Olavius sp. associated proteobacterium Delta 1]|nr:hypothetical protein D1BOALGB6SA_1482 [Olavius sp. associated proteobacterium Delta 1]
MEICFLSTEKKFQIFLITCLAVWEMISMISFIIVNNLHYK